MADGHLDLVIALSVFSHLGTGWAPWLLELHRILRPGGVLVATFIGPGMHQLFLGDEADADRIGMVVLQPGQPWDLGGPMVLHSPWWLRARWGRAFDVVNIVPSGLAAPAGEGQGIFVGTRREVAVDLEDLDAAATGEPREGPAAAFVLELLERYGAEQRTRADEAVAWARSAEVRIAALEADLAGVRSSRSWRALAPLRRTAGRIRSLRR